MSSLCLTKYCVFVFFSVPEEESDAVNPELLALLQNICDEDIVKNTTIDNDGTVTISLLTHDPFQDDPNLLMAYTGGQSDAIQPQPSLSTPSTVQIHPSGPCDNPSYVLPSSAVSNQPLSHTLPEATQPDSAQVTPTSDSSDGEGKWSSSTDSAGSSKESYAGIYMCEVCACVFRFPRQLLEHYVRENHHPSYY